MDYSQLMQDDIARGDYWSAAFHEQQRNEKIDKEGLNYEKTYNYVGYLNSDNAKSVGNYSSTTKPYDYSQVETDIMDSGLPSFMSSAVNSERNQYIDANPELSQYRGDAVDQRAKQYASDDAMSLQNIAKQISSYQDQLNNMLGNLNGMTYKDFLNSEEYNALQSSYRNAGNLAMKDTLGTLAAQTGGIASSYGAAAAQGAYNSYLNQLSDAALSLYDSRRAQNLENLSALNTQYGNLASQYQSGVSNYMNYLQLLKEDQDTSFDRNYQSGRDTVSDSQWQKTYDTGVDQFNQSLAMDKYGIDKDYTYQMASLGQRASEAQAETAYKYAALSQDNAQFNANLTQKATGTGTSTNYSSVYNTLINNGYSTEEAEYAVKELKEKGLIY